MASSVHFAASSASLKSSSLKANKRTAFSPITEFFGCSLSPRLVKPVLVSKSESMSKIVSKAVAVETESVVEGLNIADDVTQVRMSPNSSAYLPRSRVPVST